MKLNKTKEQQKCWCCRNESVPSYELAGYTGLLARLCANCLWLLGSQINSQFKMDTP